MNMPRTRDPDRFAARQAEILETATALFAERGFHQTGIAELCAALQISPGALYRYFPSKNAIIRALVEADAAETHVLLNELDDSDDFCLALLEALQATLLSVNDDSYSRLALEIAAEAQRNADVAEPLRAAAAELHAQLAAKLSHAQHNGQIDANIDTSAVAMLLLTLIDGATGQRALNPAFDIAALYAPLQRLVLGLRPPR